MESLISYHVLPGWKKVRNLKDQYGVIANVESSFLHRPDNWDEFVTGLLRKIIPSPWSVDWKARLKFPHEISNQIVFNSFFPHRFNQVQLNDCPDGLIQMRHLQSPFIVRLSIRTELLFRWPEEVDLCRQFPRLEEISLRCLDANTDEIVRFVSKMPPGIVFTIGCPWLADVDWTSVASHVDHLKRIDFQEPIQMKVLDTMRSIRHKMSTQIVVRVDDWFDFVWMENSTWLDGWVQDLCIEYSFLDIEDKPGIENYFGRVGESVARNCPLIQKLSLLFGDDGHTLANCLDAFDKGFNNLAGRRLSFGNSWTSG